MNPLESLDEEEDWLKILEMARAGAGTSVIEDGIACNGWAQALGLRLRPKDDAGWDVSDLKTCATFMLAVLEAIDTSSMQAPRPNWHQLDTPEDRLRLVGALLMDSRVHVSPNLRVFIQNMVREWGAMVPNQEKHLAYQRMLDPHYDTKAEISALREKIAALEAVIR